ncbi:MAG: bifunctional diaminohydroxyphosphoribosylaminopyrimidine deaminase/5-amino-6-(5-phosphoribosylamino)uracil reductase RibD [Gammaproteobacteria bacterium]
MSDQFSNSDQKYMNRAIQVARKGLYTTHPNPRVGCVLVKNDQIIGEGYHRKSGERHAEVNALDHAGAAANGAICYVTLEPCCHHGKTPPCTDALIEAGIGEIFIGMKDPNPLVAGKGIAALEAAGIKVTTGICTKQAEGLNPGFIKRMKSGLPYIRIKIGASLDGRTAMASGESQWITSEASRKDVQKWRARSSAVVTGIETILADDPSLNVRDPELDIASRQPIRVVLDSHNRFPANSKMCELPGETLVMTTKKTDQKNRIQIDSNIDQKVDLEKAMGKLAEKEINEVLVEAGSTLSGAFIQAGLVDELIIYLAPKFLGSAAKPLLELTGLEKLSDCVQLDIQGMKKIDKDIRIMAKII